LQAGQLGRDDPERAQRGEGHGYRRAGAIGVGDQPACPPAVLLALHAHQRSVRRVDLRQQNRHVLMHPVGAGVGADDVPCFGQPPLDRLGDLSGQRGEHKRRLHVGVQRQDDALSQVGGRVARQHPARRFAVALPGAAVAGDQFGDAEPGMPLQKLHEALADGARRAQHGDIEGGTILGHDLFLSGYAHQ